MDFLKILSAATRTQIQGLRSVANVKILSAATRTQIQGLRSVANVQIYKKKPSKTIKSVKWSLWLRVLVATWNLKLGTYLGSPFGLKIIKKSDKKSLNNL